MSDATPSPRRQNIDAVIARYHSIVDTQALGDALTAPHVGCVFAHPLRIGPERLRALLGQTGIDSESTRWNPSCLRTGNAKTGVHWSYHAGLCHVQEEASMVPPVLLDPQPGERILDMCAAPGNKTAQIALMMRGRGTVVANDRSKGRIAAIASYVDHLGLANVVITREDGAQFPDAAGSYDRVLVDAPCSGEGTLRRRGRFAPIAGNAYRELVGTQRALLRRAVHLCAPGGRIVYSTCTFAPEENELVVQAILEELSPEVTLEPVHLEGLSHSGGIREWDGQTLRPELGGCLRLWPHLSNTAGFFVAVLRKSGERSSAEESQHPEDAELAAQSPHFREVTQHYGLPATTFDGLRCIRRGRYRRAFPDNARLPQRARTISIGMPAISATSGIPRLTSAGALHFGALATQNVVDVPEALASAFAAGGQHDFPGAIPLPGYQLTRHQGFVLGNARIHQGQLESLYPRGWRR